MTTQSGSARSATLLGAPARRLGARLREPPHGHSSEMIHALLPVFLVSVLGASVTAVGLLEGAAEAIASITKVFSGTLSDWLGKRKLLVVLGYGLAAATKPFFALAPSVGWVFAARFADRVGKGIRGAPRDALIADLRPRRCAARRSACARRSTRSARSRARCSRSRSWLATGGAVSHRVLARRDPGRRRRSRCSSLFVREPRRREARARALAAALRRRARRGVLVARARRRVVHARALQRGVPDLEGLRRRPRGRVRARRARRHERRPTRSRPIRPAGSRTARTAGLSSPPARRCSSPPTSCSLRAARSRRRCSASRSGACTWDSRRGSFAALVADAARSPSCAARRSACSTSCRESRCSSRAPSPGHLGPGRRGRDVLDRGGAHDVALAVALALHAGGRLDGHAPT